MATINYRINKKAVNDPTKVYVRFRGKDFDCEVPTEILVFKKDWSESKQKIKNTASTDKIRKEIDGSLKELEDFIFNSYNKDYKEGKNINSIWLKLQINLYSNQPTNTEEDINVFLTAYANKFIEESKSRTNRRTGKKLNNRTILDFSDTLNKIKAYENFTGKKVKFSDIDLKFHTDFTAFLRNKHLLGENTIGAKIDNVKSFIRDAEINKVKVNLEYKSKKFYSPSFKPKDIYFDEKEILVIKNHPFEFDSYLDNARDWLIIGLWTGLRVSDILGLTKKDLKGDFIDNTNFKTDIEVTIPIHPFIKEILNKRKGEFPRKISDQNFNDYIKIVAKESGITERVEGSKMCAVKDEKDNLILDEKGNKMFRKQEGTYYKYELVTSHICRRSFASNLYGKLDTLTIMKITGHSTEKQFLDYIKTTPKQHAEKLSKLWATIYLK